ncbi:MAG: hypothetical protein ABI562_04500 [Chloroflexota bacterium]
MTASEFSFLALGLVLGLVSGAALVELLRARPPAPREVRLTVSHDAIPRRPSTLADDAFTSVGPEPARGGPADRRFAAASMTTGTIDRRTTVRYGTTTAGSPAPSMAGAIPVGPDRDAPAPGRIMEPALPLTGTPPPRSSGPDARMVGIPISGGDDPILGALREGGWSGLGAPGTIAEPRSGVADPSKISADASNSSGGVAVLTAVASGERGGSGRRADRATDPVATERCAAERRLAEERCELSARARDRAGAAAETLKLAQRTYDAHEAAATAAQWRSDPKAVHDAKDAAQGGFRNAVAAAKTPDQLEAAARDWLNEINRINHEAREAKTTAVREHSAATEIGTSLERLGLEADAARISAENADAACLAARSAVAECDERSDEDPSTFLVPPASPAEAGAMRLEEDETLGQALESGGEPRIFRLLRGDRAAMVSLVASLAGTDDADARRRWQLQLTALVEAIVADAIESSALEFPEGHEFWGLFSRTQGRDITRALSSLGYRFDGLGGWADGRQPTQRELSLALGYAGLDPMRMRHWPTEESMGELFRDVTVAADEYLASIAGDLTLYEMVTMLGRRADSLAETWNHWGRIRPLLLDES